MEEFGSQMRAGVSEAVQELAAARSAGDEQGAQLLADHVRYLIEVARRHGVHITDPPELRECVEG